MAEANDTLNKLQVVDVQNRGEMLLPLEELIDNYGVRPRGVIHVGGHEGQELESYLQCEVGRVVWVEANPEVAKVLADRLRPYQEHSAHVFAAYDEDEKTLDLHVMTNTMSSSLLLPEKHLEYYPEVIVEKLLKVKTKRLDTFFSAAGFKTREFNFLNLDIQGAELCALKGADTLLRTLDYVYTEVNTDYLYQDCCLLSDVDGYLETKGFRRVAIRMTTDNWGDALYKKY